MSTLYPRPSALDLIVACAAHLKLSSLLPAREPTEEEREGTAAHWVAQKYAEGYGSQLPVGTKFTSQGREWEIDLDMVVGAHMHVNAMGGVHTDLRIEDPVGVPQIHEKCHGTPDAWRYLQNVILPPGQGIPEHPVNVVRVGDYKYGHRFVEVFSRYQLIAYFFGVLNRLNLTVYDPNLWAELIITQPRSYHRDGPVRIWRVPAILLNASLEAMKRAAAEALGENPIAQTGTHCLDCEARLICRTLQTATYSYMDYASTAEAVELPPDVVGQELNLVDEAIKRLEARRTGLAAHAEAMLRAGQRVAFYHMEPGQSRLVYKDDVNIDEVIGLGDVLGIDLRKPQTKKDMLVTPKQAIDLGVDELTMKSYAHRPPATLKLARDNSTAIRKVFSR